MPLHKELERVVGENKVVFVRSARQEEVLRFAISKKRKKNLHGRIIKEALKGLVVCLDVQVLVFEVCILTASRHGKAGMYRPTALEDEAPIPLIAKDEVGREEIEPASKKTNKQKKKKKDFNAWDKSNTVCILDHAPHGENETHRRRDETPPCRHEC